MDIIDFKNIAQGLQAAGVSIAVIVGGIWAFFKFRSFKELELAKMEYEKAKKALLERSVMNISLSSAIRPINEGWLATVSVEFSNAGNREEVLRLNEGAVYFAKINGVKKNTVAYGEWKKNTITGWSGGPDSSTVAPGEKKSFDFLLPLAERGQYSVEILVPGSLVEESSRKEVLKTEEIEANLTVWSARTQLFIEQQVANA